MFLQSTFMEGNVAFYTSYFENFKWLYSFQIFYLEYFILLYLGMWGRPCLKLTEGHIFFGKITKGINQKTAAQQRGMISQSMKWFTEVVGIGWTGLFCSTSSACLEAQSESQSLKFFLERFLSCVLRSKSVIERLQFAGILCKNVSCHHLIGWCHTGLSTSLIPGDEPASETRQVRLTCCVRRGQRCRHIYKFRIAFYINAADKVSLPPAWFCHGSFSAWFNVCCSFFLLWSESFCSPRTKSQMKKKN